MSLGGGQALRAHETVQLELCGTFNAHALPRGAPLQSRCGLETSAVLELQVAMAQCLAQALGQELCVLAGPYR